MKTGRRNQAARCVKRPPGTGRDGQTLSENETLLNYRVRNGTVKFATNAFFFQEGHAKNYEAARYGQFRVNDQGELLLTALYDKDLNKLGQSIQSGPGKQEGKPDSF